MAPPTIAAPAPHSAISDLDKEPFVQRLAKIAKKKPKGEK